MRLVEPPGHLAGLGERDPFVSVPVRGAREQRDGDRVTGDHRVRLANEPKPDGDVGGVVVVDLDRIELDAELVGGDLREDGLDALAERADTDPDDDRPVGPRR